MKKRRKRKVRYDRMALLIGVATLLVVILIVGINQVFFNSPSYHTFDKKAVWISYLDMETLKDQSEDQFVDAFTMMCENAKTYDCDTLIVQTRAFQDAIYPSSIFSYATYITSSDMDYDALELMVAIAHKQNLNIEAWVNPYRISYQEKQYQQFINHVKFPKKDIIKNGSNAILNPASEASNTLIIKGIEELLAYDVDGIHMDDYFYPEWAYEDTSESQRKQVVNEMIKEVYALVHKNHKSFGISPQGNIENCRAMGADIDTWLQEEGYVDYIMPQIYWSNAWGMDGSVTMFNDRIDAWSELAKNSDVPLFAGLALYLCGSEVYGDLGWEQTQDNLKQQMDYLKEKRWSGYAFFSYSNLIIERTQTELENIQ